MPFPKFDTRGYDRYYCAIAIPYKPDSLEIDEEAYRKRITYFVASKDFPATRGALIANPEAGEIFHLTTEERERLIRIMLEKRPAGLPIFASCYFLSPWLECIPCCSEASCRVTLGQ